MATLIGTTSPTISATQITSPLTYMDTGNGMIEYTGSVFLNNNATVDILTNNICIEIINENHENFKYIDKPYVLHQYHGDSSKKPNFTELSNKNRNLFLNVTCKENLITVNI
jgi:hypothetical protein